MKIEIDSDKLMQLCYKAYEEGFVDRGSFYSGADVKAISHWNFSDSKDLLDELIK